MDTGQRFMAMQMAVLGPWDHRIIVYMLVMFIMNMLMVVFHLFVHVSVHMTLGQM